VGDAASAAGIEIDSGLGFGLEQANRAFAKMDKTIAGGNLTFLPRQIALATVAVDNLEQELNDLRRAGKPTEDLTRAIERMKMKLTEATLQAGLYKDKMEEVTRNVGAVATGSDFGKVATAISLSLGKMLEMMSKVFFAAQAIGRGLDTVGMAAEEMGRMFGGLDEETQETTNSMREFGRALSSFDIGGASAALGRFAGSVIVDVTDASKSATGSLKDLQAQIESITGVAPAAVEAFNKIKEAQRWIVQAREDAARALELQTNATVMQAQAEEKVGQLTDESRAELEKLLDAWEARGDVPPAKLQALADKYGLVSAAQRAFLEQIEGEEKVLRRRTDALLGAVEAAERDGKLTTEARATIRKLLTEELALWDRMKVTPPEALERQAAAYGVAGKAAREAAAATRGYADALRGESESLEKQTAAIVEGTRASQLMGELTGAALAKAREDIAALVTKYQELGIAVPDELAQIGNEVGAFVEANVAKWNAYVEKLKEVMAEGKKLYDESLANTKKLEEQLDALKDTPTTSDSTAKMQKELDALREKGVLTAEEVVRQSQLQDAVNGVTGAEERSAIAKAKLAKETEILDALEKERLDRLKIEDAVNAKLSEAYYSQIELQAQLNEANRGTAEAVGEVVTKMDEAGTSISNVGEESSVAFIELKDGTKVLTNVADEFDNVAGKAELAKEPVDEIGESFKTLGEQADEALPKLETMRDLIREIRKEAAAISIGEDGSVGAY
jgi:hypothetical protein